MKTKSFDDDFDSEPEEEIPKPVKKKVEKKPQVKDEEEDDSDFEDPDLIEVPGGGSSLKTLQNIKSGDAGPSMPDFCKSSRFCHNILLLNYVGIFRMILGGA